MIIKETLEETVRCAVPYDPSTHNEEFIRCQIRSHPELEVLFQEQLSENPQWVDEVEKAGKLYFIFNITFKYNYSNKILQKKWVKLSYVGKRRRPCLSINLNL